MKEIRFEDQFAVMGFFCCNKASYRIKGMHPLFVEGFRVQANALRATPQCMTDLNSAYLPVSVPTV